MKTLWDVENENSALTKKEKKLLKISKILGRENELPSKLSNDELINCGLSEPAEILKKGGYINIGRGWIKKISRTQRYHAYPYEDEFTYKWIYIHKDITQNGRHKATKDVLDEKIRLKEFAIPRPHKKKNDVFLSKEERLKALAELKNNKPIRKTLWKKLLEVFD